MAAACARSGVLLVTGDTKVVDRGKGDGIYINTSGIGRVRDGVHVGPARAEPGDVVIVSGPVGDHGIAVMAARDGIDFETALVSDSAPVIAPVRALLDAVPGTHVLRDPTRGGLATALCEIALASRVGIRLDETDVPVREEVRGACELLGFDPLYVACEGRFLAIVPGAGAESGTRGDPVAAGRRGGACRRERAGGGRGPRGAADADRQPPAAGAALGRAAAEDLLRHGFRPDATGRVRLGPQGGGIVWPA